MKKRGPFRVVSLVAIGALVAVEFVMTRVALSAMSHSNEGDIIMDHDSQVSFDKRTLETRHKGNIHKMVEAPTDRRNKKLTSAGTDIHTIEPKVEDAKERFRQYMKDSDKDKSNKFEGTGAGFIHLGKAAGSTLSRLLRNGCHSFVRKPCHNVVNETIVSEMVTDYYHTPDVDKIPRSKHATYFVTARDPLERLISAFVYLHPKNRHARHEKGNGVNAKPNEKAYKCFPTLEEFAQAVGRRKDYSDCSIQAQKAVDGRIPIMNHLWGNYQRMVAPIHPEAQIFVFRNEHLWHDWVTVNSILAPNRTVVIPDGEKAHFRDMEKVKQPISRDLSDKGRAFLCRAVRQEYEVYLSLLSRAVNLNATDIQEARDQAQENCSNLVAKRVSLTALRGGTNVAKK